MSLLNFAPSNISSIFLTLETFHFEMSLLKEVYWNIAAIFTTLEVSHLDMSPLNCLAKPLFLNTLLISVNSDVSIQLSEHFGPF